METEKLNALREVRKLNDILNSWGNVLVPNIPGKAETSAKERAFYFLDILRNKYGIDTEEKLLCEINNINEILV